MTSAPARAGTRARAVGSGWPAAVAAVRAVAVAVIVAVTAGALAACAPIGATTAVLPPPPPGRIPPPPTLAAATDIYNGDVGDPFVLTATGTLPAGSPRYVVFGTDNRRDRIPTATSDDLRHWVGGSDAFPVLPRWASPDPDNSHTWAPAVLSLGPRRYVMYVTVHDTATDRQCLATATATAALGPYTNHTPGPLICQAARGGSIDASVATGDGVRTLVWKSDGNAIGQPGQLWAQRLGADGLGVVGTPHLLLTAAQTWQAGIVEGPSLLAAGRGGWWLWYAGNSYNRSAYATGVAYCRTLEDPCQEASTGPVLSTAAGQFSPGGLETFRSVDGTLWASFATWTRPARDGIFHCCRALDLARVTGY